MGRKRGRPTTIVDPVVGERIKIAYKGSNLTQERLAEMLNNGIDDNGFQQRTVSNWVCGDTQPNDNVLHQIASICNVPYCWLANLDGKAKQIFSESESILDSISPESMEEHEKIEKLLLKKGYDLAVLQMENTNFMLYIRGHIDGLEDTKEIEKAINECIDDYELLKRGFGK